MNNQLTPFYCKLPFYIKDKLEEQAKFDRVPMVSIIQELLILGLASRASMREANIRRFDAVQKLQQYPIGFTENIDDKK